MPILCQNSCFDQRQKKLMCNNNKLAVFSFIKLKMRIDKYEFNNNKYY